MTDIQHKSVQAALVAAQAEFGTVTKGSVNPAFKSRYADLADVVAVVVPVLSRHGVAVLHYFTGEGAAMRTEFHHAASGTRVWCDVPLIVERQNMQGMKSATTYAKRIGLESLSGIAPEDDDGNAAAKAAPRQSETRSNVESFDAAKEGRRIMAAIDAAQDVAALDALLEAEAETFKGFNRASFDKLHAAISAKRTALTVDDEIRY